MQQLILATASVHRREAFAQLGLDFTTEASDVDERTSERPTSPEELVLNLAKLKASEIAKKHTSGIVIGFDSVGWFNGTILEKPATRTQGSERLKTMSGNSFQFFTGIFMINIETGAETTRVVKTSARLRKLSQAEIDLYLDQDQDFNTYALGFDSLGHYGMTFIKNIEGSYNNLLRGIPVEAIVEMLPLVGFEHVAAKI
jgi:septum formation protein